MTTQTSEPFSFRLRVELPPGDHLSVEAEELEIVASTGNRPAIRLRSGARGSPINKHSTFAVVGGPFDTEAQAREVAQCARRALLIWAVANRTGMDLGGRPSRAVITDYGKRWLSQVHQRPVRLDYHGIDVYPTKANVAFARLDVKARVGRSVEALMREVSSSLDSHRRLTSKQELAGELYSLSYFETSDRGRFITLLIAIEALVETDSRSPEAQALVEALQIIARESNVLGADVIANGLTGLKRESIRQAGRRITEHLLPERMYDGKTASEFFAYVYGVRSAILHRGEAPDEDRAFLDLCNLTQQFVGDLLIASYAEMP
jgi:hypothetical protein